MRNADKGEWSEWLEVLSAQLAQARVHLDIRGELLKSREDRTSVAALNSLPAFFGPNANRSPTFLHYAHRTTY